MVAGHVVAVGVVRHGAAGRSGSVLVAGPGARRADLVLGPGPGTLQAVITPDLVVAFPHLVFFQYVVGHLGIVLAALYLVIGLGLAPRAGAALRVFGIITLALGKTTPTSHLPRSGAPRWASGVLSIVNEVAHLTLGI